MVSVLHKNKSCCIRIYCSVTFYGSMTVKKHMVGGFGTSHYSQKKKLKYNVTYNILLVGKSLYITKYKDLQY